MLGLPFATQDVITLDVIADARLYLVTIGEERRYVFSRYVLPETCKHERVEQFTCAVSCDGEQSIATACSMHIEHGHV